MKDYDIVFWGKTPFNHPLKLNALNMAEALAEHNRVLYIEPAIFPMRFPFDKIGEFRKYIALSTEVKNKLYVHTPFYILPFSRLPFVKKVNQAFVLWRINKAIRNLKFRQYINWFWKHDDYFFIERLGNHFSVLELSDDQSLFPVFRNEADRNAFRTERDRIISKADIVFTNSPVLRSELKILNQRMFYFPQGHKLIISGKACSIQQRFQMI